MTDTRRNNFDPNSSQLPHVAFTRNNATVPQEVPYLIGESGQSQLRYVMPNGQFYANQQVPPQPPANNNISAGNTKRVPCSSYIYFGILTIVIPLAAVLIFFATFTAFFNLYVGLAFLLIFAMSFLSCTSRYINKDRNVLTSWWNGLICTSLIFCYYVSYKNNNPYAIVILSFTVSYMIISKFYSIFEKDIKAFNTAVLSQK